MSRKSGLLHCRHAYEDLTPSVRINELSVRSFRNLSDVNLCPGPGLNWFFGRNGQGKTSLLESVYAALRGKSFRPYSSRADWVPVAGSPEMPPCVKLEILDERGYPLSCQLLYSKNRQWETVLNGKRTPVSRLRQRVPVVAFSPDDHALVRWEPEVRRDFLDEMLTDVCPGYAEALERYQAALKSRNRVLRDGPRGGVTEELRAWSWTLAKHGLELLLFRLEMWPDFERHFADVMGNLFRDNEFRIELLYAPDFGGTQTEQECLSHIMASLQKDLDTGWTHRGPHRDDFRILLDGIDSRGGASQGQSRTLALALKWTHANWVQQEREEIPLFLVDDFSSEIDASRRDRLLFFLAESKGQVFITGTDVSLIDSKGFCDYNLYSVTGGQVASKSHMRVGEVNV